MQSHLALPPSCMQSHLALPLLHAVRLALPPLACSRSLGKPTPATSNQRGLPLSARARTGSGACGYPTRARRRLRPPTRSVRLPSGARRKWEWRSERGLSKREKAWPAPREVAACERARWDRAWWDRLRGSRSVHTVNRRKWEPPEPKWESREPKWESRSRHAPAASGSTHRTCAIHRISTRGRGPPRKA